MPGSRSAQLCLLLFAGPLCRRESRRPMEDQKHATQVPGDCIPSPGGAVGPGQRCREKPWLKAEVHSDSLFPVPAWVETVTPSTKPRYRRSSKKRAKTGVVGRLALTTSRAGRNRCAEGRVLQTALATRNGQRKTFAKTAGPAESHVAHGSFHGIRRHRVV